MASILNEYRQHGGDPAMVTADQMDVAYANLTNCEPMNDIALIEHSDGEPVGYARVTWDELDDGSRDYVVFAPVHPSHLAEPLFRALVAAQEAHMRPNLDNVPDLPLPDGVEVRPVTPEMLRPIFDAHWEAFRGDWDFTEATEEDAQQFLDDPLRDESLWKIAWIGDTVVGQVKSFNNAEENAVMGYLRGYTEYISTHAAWRNRGIAGSLLASSLRELKVRGMTEAALGADTENPGGAFQLYTKLGFRLRSYSAAYAKPLT